MTQTSVLARARAEAPLLFILAPLAAFLAFGPGWLADLSNPLWLALMFGWLFATILRAALKVVHHVDCLAVKLGEPYGTPILALSIISIEVLMISALMLSAQRTYLLLGVVHLILFLTYLDAALPKIGLENPSPMWRNT